MSKLKWQLNTRRHIYSNVYRSPEMHFSGKAANRHILTTSFAISVSQFEIERDSAASFLPTFTLPFSSFFFYLSPLAFLLRFYKPP